MQQQKQFLETNQWKCQKCPCPNKLGWDCLNNNYKGYMITLRTSMARILYKGRVIASAPLYDLEKKMKEQKLLPVNEIA